MTDRIKEEARLTEAREAGVPWRKWGPYLSERQWGTVREDYSKDGNAWNYFSHDQARSRAYRWGEDGIAGISDDHQRLCFAVAFWNGADPILKERIFGLTNSEGNHGEDAKEYYFYLDNTPTHSWMQYLYKYPQRAYPYDDLVGTNARISRRDHEYELLDTGVFDDDRYFDVFIEYAKAGPEDMLIRIRAVNRGPESAALHLLPSVWFRNTWSQPGALRPELKQAAGAGPFSCVLAREQALGEYTLYADGAPELLFTENETNFQRLFGTANPTPYVKDGINDYVVHGRKDAVNPGHTGTKAAAHYFIEVNAGAEAAIRLRLRAAGSRIAEAGPFADFDSILKTRKAEADEFYASLTPESLPEDAANVMRQALAGMLWSKQYYYFDLENWLQEHDCGPGSPNPRVRNVQWVHMLNNDIISMPDKWEYPWYAAWDLAFHAIPLALVDIDFAKQQLDMMLRGLYLHPNGQLPAYEWNFSDVNPPVHAWSTLRIFEIEKESRGTPDYEFLKRAFHKLLVNFTWWVNRKDRDGRNLFEGGFLGLDNIGVFDRSQPLPTGGHLEQADGTAWMAFFCQTMFELSLHLAGHDPIYTEMAEKFLEHFFWIAAAMDRIGVCNDEMWDEEDGFFYDVLRMPDGSAQRLRLRTMVGLLPLCATTTIAHESVEMFPGLVTRARDFLHRNPHLIANIASPGSEGVAGRHLLSILNETKLRRILARMLDEREFLSPYGIRSLSRCYESQPYVLQAGGGRYEVRYTPAESDSGLFGGNSNWRGPVWFPVNALILRALAHFYLFYGDDFKVEFPTGSGRLATLGEISSELSARLRNIFLRDSSGRRPVYGATRKFQEDPHWRDLILFYEYFHGDNGAGIGASHQTGWTGFVARLFHLSELKLATVLQDVAALNRRRMAASAPAAVRGAGS